MNPYQSTGLSDKVLPTETLFAIVFTLTYLWIKFDFYILDEFWRDFGFCNITNVVRSMIVAIVIIFDGLKFLIPFSFLIGYLYG